MKSNEKSYKDCRTFIGYRRGQHRRDYALSENIAGLIWYWIQNRNNKEYFPAFFQECYGIGDITFLQDGIEKYMPKMDTAFFVICPYFFEEIISMYHTYMDNYSNSTEAIAKTKEKLTGNPDKNIFYFELKSALEHLGPNKIRLIYVNDSGKNVLNELDKKVLIKIFGKKWETLLSTPNTIIEFNYVCVKDSFENFYWSSSNPDSQTRLVNEIEDLKEVTTFKNTLFQNKNSNHNTVLDTQKIENIKDDLKSCAHSVILLQQPKDKGPSRFRAEDHNIVYDDPVLILTKEPDIPRLAKCMVKEFKKYRNDFQLPSDEFRYWNVDLDPESDSYKGISVCAVCFGMLILQHNIKKYRALFDNSYSTDISDFENARERSINLLIALRNPIKKTWPTLWGSPEDRIYVDGTVTQTTLSLSALLICDFLSTNNNITPDALKKRCEFIWESTECLLNGNQNSAETAKRYWGYKFKCPSNEPTSVAFTAYALETLLKIKSTLSGLIEYFETNDSSYAEQLTRHINEINQYIPKICNYFIGAHRSYMFSRNLRENPSITHTALTIKALVAFSNSQINTDEKELLETKTKVDALLSRVIPNFVESVEDKTDDSGLSIEEWERFEVPKDMVRTPGTDGIDQYEHCAELIVAETLIKIAESEQYREYKERATVCLEWILDTYMEGAAKFLRENDKVLIRSSNDNFKYPIFYLYYYRMVLMDYLLFTNGINDDKNKEKQS